MQSYPPSLIPTQPVLSFGSFLGGARRVPSVLDAGNCRFVTSGRVAIALALKQMKIGAGDSVMVPAYHCASMIEPVIWSGATPVFYRINADTSVNLDDIAAKLDGTTRLVMATNYFGFPQNLSAIRTFCDARGLRMLEDCAHSFLGEHQGKAVGSWGDYAIASSMKFFPIYEGGCLVSSRNALGSVQLHSAGVGFEAKVAFNTLEDGFEYRRLGMVKALLRLPMFLKNFVWGQIKARKPSTSQSMAPGSSDGGFGFDPNWLDKRSSYFSRLMLWLVSRERMAVLRRKNYLRLQDAMQGLPGVRPLFPQLPERVYPWVFPLLTDDPQPVFHMLKEAGVPIIRFGEYLWPGVDASVCEHSVDLSRRVLQFPCHQELKQEEIDWMIQKIKDAVLSQASPTT
ncbi:MAG: DegT/DnrJ/EryC1/StrS aminotransferase family protein [Herminiimonas sp.]|nr:DegT/DnrJ/EryC1/StrS aminotransferase family protein [Herminiimonas sp.]